jgi:hypothetical protein
MLVLLKICGLVSWLAGVGCGDDGAQRHEEPSSDAAAPRDDAASGRPKSDVEAVLAKVFARFDDTVRANCPSFVDMGAYASVDECAMWQLSRDDWAPCVAGVVAEQPMPTEALEVYECLADQFDANSECLSTRACDAEARAECRLDLLQCLGSDLARALALETSVRCPDITLLPRQQ